MAPIHNLSHALHTAAGDKAPLHLVANRASGSGEGGGLAARLQARCAELGRTLTLHAPASGVIVKDPPVAGMRFMPGEPLFRIADLSRVWLIADVFEQDLALVRVGTQAALVVSAFPDRTFPGEVTFIYPTLNAETRTARVRIELANPKGQLKPGMYGNAQITLVERKDVLTVPAASIQRDGDETYCWCIEDGKACRKSVVLGVRVDDDVEVISGLSEDEPVVRSPANGLKAGQALTAAAS